MNKKEVLEIRKQFSPENCAITRICGCYVDHEKEKKMEMKKAFLSLPEEEAFKYFETYTFRNDRKEPHQHGIPTRPGIERRHTEISDEIKEQQASGRPSSRRIL